MPDLHAVPPNALIKLVAKGVLFAEMDANLKEDRSAVEDDYQLVSAADVVLNEARDLKDIVLAHRADKEESDSEDEEHVRDPSDRAMGAAPARLQAAPQPVEQKPVKPARKKPKTSAMHPHPYSPTRSAPLDAFPQQAHPEPSHLPDEGPSSTAGAGPRQTPQAAPSIRNTPNSHVQGGTHRAQRLPGDTKPRVEVLDAQSREVRMCAWSPVGAVLASGLGDPEALLWSSTPQSGGTMLPTVLAHSGAESDKSSVVECMDWQSAGTMLATGSMDGWVRVWNKSGQLLQTLKGHQSAVTCLKFSKQTNLLLSGSVDKTAIVWAADTGLQMQRVTAHTGSVCCVAWKDDQHFATASADHVIHMHSGGQMCTATLRGGIRDLTHLTWSPCGVYVVSCCEGGTVMVWSAHEATCKHTLMDHTGDVNAVTWDPTPIGNSDQHLLATASQDQTVRLWDVLHGSCQHKIVLGSKVRSLDFHPSGGVLVTGCDDGDACIWQIRLSGLQKITVPCNGAVTSIVWNPEGDKIAAACRTQRIHLISVATGVASALFPLGSM
ncbi:Transducin (beta)-like 1 X-linked receptor 1 [Trebouxia sp. C0009 RCD-2024]